MRAAARRCCDYHCGSRGRRNDRERTAWNGVQVEAKRKCCVCGMGVVAIVSEAGRHGFNESLYRADLRGDCLFRRFHCRTHPPALDLPWRSTVECYERHDRVHHAFLPLGCADLLELPQVNWESVLKRALMLLVIKSDTGSPPRRPSRHRRRSCYTP